MTVAEKAAAFRRLHEGPGAFVIPNPWDVGTASVLAALGFEALATTSSGLAYSLGRRDGDAAVTREETLRHAAAIVEATPLPVSADLQSGFGDDPDTVAETIRAAAAVGLAGGSIEDATIRRDEPVYPPTQAAERVAGVASSSGAVSVDQTLTIDGQTQTQSCTSSDCSNTLTESSASGGTNVSSTDVAYFGFGGMRGIGTGSIDVAGVTGTVTKALLYWNGPTNSTDAAANASVTFNGTPVRGVNIGFANDNCWGFQNSQSYRADVTSLVSGNGTYSLADFTKLPAADLNGASLVVFYDDGNTANDRNVALFNGNDSNIESPFDPAGWDVTIPSVDFPGGSASLDFIVSDGQSFLDDALVLNGSELVPAGPIFQGDSVPAGAGSGNGSLWDVESFGITSFLSPGTNTLHLTTGAFQDCLSLVVAAANVPAAAPIG